MKKFCFLFILFTSCIETDLQLPQPEALRINLAGEIFRDIRVNKSYPLQAVFTDIDGVEDSLLVVTWSSSDAAIFRIDGTTGIGVAPGKVTITASAKGLEATDTITVIASQESLTISNFVTRLEIGKQFELGVNYIDVAGEVMDITPEWESLDTTIATVDENGLLIAIGVGMTTIKSSFGNVSASLILEVFDDRVDPEIRITIFKETIKVGENFTFEAVYYGPEGQPDATVSPQWASSNSSILTIDVTTGVATAMMAGETTLTASSGGVSTSINVTVEIEITTTQESFTISNFVNRLQVGEQFEFDVNYIDVVGEVMDISPDWESSDITIATVDENGLVSAVSIGMTTIKSSFGNVSDSLMLEVFDDRVDPEIRITVFKETIKIGENFTFEAVYFGSNSQPDATVSPQWTSSNSSILAIDVATGVATAVAAGTTTITASSTSGGGVSASINVTVMRNEAATERTGTLMGTGYNISGSFSLSMNEQNEVILTVSNYNPAGPGPFFYLTNQTNNVSNGLALGDARPSGSHTFNISELSPDVELYTYGVLMVWCQPFSVRLGYGEFDN